MIRGNEIVPEHGADVVLPFNVRKESAAMEWLLHEYRTAKPSLRFGMCIKGQDDRPTAEWNLTGGKFG